MVSIKCFSLDNSGDVEIRNNKIVMVSGKELIKQKIQKVIGTNKNEWFGDSSEGINFKNVLGKNVNEENVKSEILDALMQVDDSFIITEFSMEIDSLNRALYVSFTATNSEGEALQQEVIL